MTLRINVASDFVVRRLSDTFGLLVVRLDDSAQLPMIHYFAAFGGNVLQSVVFIGRRGFNVY